MSKQKYFWFRIKVKVDSKQMQHICYPRVYVSGCKNNQIFIQWKVLLLSWVQSYPPPATISRVLAVYYVLHFTQLECTPFGLYQPAEIKQTIWIVIFLHISKLELQFVNNFTFSNTWTGQLQRCSWSAACDIAREAWPGPHTGRCKTRGVSEK